MLFCKIYSNVCQLNTVSSVVKWQPGKWTAVRGGGTMLSSSIMSPLFYEKIQRDRGGLVTFRLNG